MSVARSDQPSLRVVGWGLSALLVRLLIGVASTIAGTAGGPKPGLVGPSLALAILGAAVGIGLALRRGERASALAAGCAGGVIGVFASALAVAACRVIESPLGGAPAGLLFLAPLIWGVLGAILGAVGAVLGTYGGADTRARLAKSFGRDLPAALIEDVAAVVLAFLVVYLA